MIWLPLILALAAEWPQFLGPARNGSSLERISSTWKSEPKRLWSKPVGAGFSGPIVSGGKVILFHRQGGSEILSAFDSATGQPLWESKSPATYRDDFGFDEGPRSTPCVAGGKVYAMGADGLVRCVNLTDGKQLWAVDTRREFQAPKGFFGMACSPLVHKDDLLLNVGGTAQAGIVALDRHTGALRWKATDHEASYSSPVSGPGFTAFFTREGLALLDPKSGKILATKPWRARMHASVNAAAPLVLTNLVFITASYDAGALLVRFDGSDLTEIWSSDDAISAHYAAAVFHGGHLYGFHGRQETGPVFRCVDFMTGKVRWEQPSFGAGTVTLAGDQLLILKENGELLLAPASAEKFAIAGRAHFLGSDSRAYPALSDHHFYARDKRNLVCLALP